MKKILFLIISFICSNLFASVSHDEQLQKVLQLLAKTRSAGVRSGLVYGSVGSLALYKGYSWLTAPKKKALSYFKYHSSGPSFWKKVVSLAKAPLGYLEVFDKSAQIKKASLNVIQTIQTWIKNKTDSMIDQSPLIMQLQSTTETGFIRDVLLAVQGAINCEYAEIDATDFNDDTFIKKVDEICDYAQQSARDYFMLYIDKTSDDILSKKSFQRLLVRMKASNNKVILVLGVDEFSDFLADKLRKLEPFFYDIRELKTLL